MSLNDEFFEEQNNELQINLNSEIKNIEEINLASENYKSLLTKSSRIIALEDMFTDIKNKNNIDRLTASSINTLFENLFSESLSLEQYTNYPTQTNYNKTIASMQNTISLEQLNLLSSFNEFFANLTNNLIKVNEEIRNDYLPKMDDLKNIQYKTYSSIIDGTWKTSDTVIIYDNLPMNILNVNIKDLDINKISIDKELNKDMLSLAVNKIKDALDNTTMQLYFYYCINNIDINKISSREFYSEYINKPIEVKDIVEFFKMHNTLDTIEKLKELSITYENELKTLKETIDNKIADKETNESIEAITTSSYDEVELLLGKIKDLMVITYGYNNLIFNIDKVLKFLIEL